MKTGNTHFTSGFLQQPLHTEEKQRPLPKKSIVMRPATECRSERTWRAIRHRLLALTSADSAGCSHTKLDFRCLSELTPICSIASQSAEHTILLVQQCGRWGFRMMEWPPHPSFLSSRTSWLPGFQREENYSPHMQPASQSVRWDPPPPASPRRPQED